MASPRVAYMGGAVSRFGDIHQALGYRWTADGDETLFLRGKVLVDARAAGIRYPISGMWGGATDDDEGLRALGDGAARPRVLRDDDRRAPAHPARARGVHADAPRRSRTGRASTASRPRPKRAGTGPIVDGDPNQGEGHVVHIAHVGSARLNLEWTRALGLID